MRCENMAKIALNAAVKLQKVKAVNGNRGRGERRRKRFAATFTADVILRMRRELCCL